MATTTQPDAPLHGGKLPQPADRPTADILIYDGRCRICRWQIERLHRWDTRQSLAFLALDDPQVAQRFADLSHETLMREMVLVDRRGCRHHGADAVRYLSRRLPRLWPLSPLLHLPGTLPFWRWCYRRLANWRYQIGGPVACDDGMCGAHARR